MSADVISRRAEQLLWLLEDADLDIYPTADGLTWAVYSPTALLADGDTLEDAIEAAAPVAADCEWIDRRDFELATDRRTIHQCRGCGGCGCSRCGGRGEYEVVR